MLTNCTSANGTGARPHAAAAVHVGGEGLPALGSADEVVSRSLGEAVTVSKQTTSRPWAPDGGQEPEPEPEPNIAYPAIPPGQRVSTKRVPVEHRDCFRALSVGGGRRGDPGAREPERVREGALDGFVSERAAPELYGGAAAPWAPTSRAGSC